MFYTINLRLTLIHAKSEKLEQTWKVTKIYLSSSVAHSITYTLRIEGEDVVFSEPLKCRNAHIQPQFDQFDPFSQMTQKVCYY